MEDRELLDLIPLFEKLSKVDSVYAVLKSKDLQQGNNCSLMKTNSAATTSTTQTAAVT
jgi:hypothetical protein